MASYSYDGLGRQIQITEGGGTTDVYNSASDQSLEEYIGSTVTAIDVWSPIYVNALIYRDHHCPVGGGKGVMPGHGCYSVNTGHPWLSLKVLNVSQPN